MQTRTMHGRPMFCFRVAHAAHVICPILLAVVSEAMVLLGTVLWLQQLRWVMMKSLDFFQICWFFASWWAGTSKSSTLVMLCTCLSCKSFVFWLMRFPMQTKGMLKSVKKCALIKNIECHRHVEKKKRWRQNVLFEKVKINIFYVSILICSLVRNFVGTWQQKL